MKYLRSLMVCLLLVACQEEANQFEGEINAFQEADLSSPPPEGIVLFVGSSTIRMWTDLKKDFPEEKVLNRGFGGSQFSDVLHFYNELFLDYKPSRILIYEGDNDINAGKSLETIQKDISSLESLLSKNFPSIPVAYISAKPSLSRWNLKAEYEAYNNWLAAYCEQTPNRYYLDTWSPMLDEAGQPIDSIFIEDGLHMNRWGYDIWKTATEEFVSGQLTN